MSTTTEVFCSHNQVSLQVNLIQKLALSSDYHILRTSCLSLLPVPFTHFETPTSDHFTQIRIATTCSQFRTKI